MAIVANLAPGNRSGSLVRLCETRGQNLRLPLSICFDRWPFKIADNGVHFWFTNATTAKPIESYCELVRFRDDPNFQSLHDVTPHWSSRRSNADIVAVSRCLGVSIPSKVSGIQNVVVLRLGSSQVKAETVDEALIAKVRRHELLAVRAMNVMNGLPRRRVCGTLRCT
jgi:hypothetical protein